MLNRTIIAKQIARRLGITQALGRQALDIMIDMIIQELADGHDARLMRFGTFAIMNRAARTNGRNPFTGLKMAIPASVGVRFRAHNSLKAALNPAPVRKVGGNRNSPMPQRKRA